MDILFLDIVAIFMILSSLLFIIWAFLRRDYSILAAGLTRLYFVTALLFYKNCILSFDLLAVKLASLVIIFGDIIVATFHIFSRKYISELGTAEAFKNLYDKYRKIVDGTVVGIFTVDISGNFEFANQRMLEILGLNAYYRRNIYEFFSRKDMEKVLSNIHKIHQISYRDAHGISHEARIRLVRTYNGHETITGNVFKFD